MPLIAHSTLPSFARLAREGVDVREPAAWDGPVLRVGLVNTMADGALAATERQFLRLLAAATPAAGVELHACGRPEIPRGDEARRHCDAHYLTLEALRGVRPHAVIVCGANVPDPDLARLYYREALVEVIEWVEASVPLAMFSCLATHAVLHYRHGKPRRALPDKRWGVFAHRVVAPEHPLCAGLPARLAAPHSRWNDVPAADFAAAGLQVLVVDDGGGVHLAATPDGRHVFMQGHPEYDPVSLLKEHKREVLRFAAGARADCPAPPHACLDAAGERRLAAHAADVARAVRAGAAAPSYPEDELLPHLADSWRAPTERLFASWLARLEDEAGV